MARLGSALLLVGLALATFAVVQRLDQVQHGYPMLALPTPAAVTVGGTEAIGSPAPETPTPIAHVTNTPEPVATEAAVPTSVATVIPAIAAPAAATSFRAADTDDRASQVLDKGGYAVRLAIPAIKLDTPVEQAGIAQDRDGNWIWETRPFVAVHYGDLTSLVGAQGNAVIAGHVVTLREGNVFRFLYQLELGDRIQVWDEGQREYDFHVVNVKLVSPSDISAIAQTPDETLTLITCGGQFDPVTRQFSDRLIVTAKPLHEPARGLISPP